MCVKHTLIDYAIKTSASNNDAYLRVFCDCKCYAKWNIKYRSRPSLLNYHTSSISYTIDIICFCLFLIAHWFCAIELDNRICRVLPKLLL